MFPHITINENDIRMSQTEHFSTVRLQKIILAIIINYDKIIPAYN